MEARAEVTRLSEAYWCDWCQESFPGEVPQQWLCRTWRRPGYTVRHWSHTRRCAACDYRAEHNGMSKGDVLADKLSKDMDGFIAEALQRRDVRAHEIITEVLGGCVAQWEHKIDVEQDRGDGTINLTVTLLPPQPNIEINFVVGPHDCVLNP